MTAIVADNGVGAHALSLEVGGNVYLVRTGESWACSNTRVYGFRVDSAGALEEFPTRYPSEGPAPEWFSSRRERTDGLG